MNDIGRLSGIIVSSIKEVEDKKIIGLASYDA